MKVLVCGADQMSEMYADENMIPLETYPQDWIDDCNRWRGELLTGKYAHWCPDWDFLPIDETCKNEWPCGCNYQEWVDAGKPCYNEQR